MRRTHPVQLDIMRRRIERRIKLNLKMFFAQALTSDLQTMESILGAFEEYAQDEGEALNLAIIKVTGRDKRRRKTCTKHTS